MPRAAHAPGRPARLKNDVRTLTAGAFPATIGVPGSNNDNKHPFAVRHMASIVRTLVIAPNWIGDAVMAQPLLALIRRQDPLGMIDVVAPPHVAPVFGAMAEVEDVIEASNVHGKLDLRGRLALSNRLRRLRYDRCFVLPNSFKSALVPWLARIPQRIGHRGESRYGLINRMRGILAGSQTPMVEFYAQLASDTGQAPQAIPDPVLIRQGETERATRTRFGIGNQEKLLVLAPGAEYGPAKRWPTRHFAALASMAAAEWPEISIVLLGSAKERSLATEIGALSGQPLKNLCGDTSLSEAIALIAQADGVVSNDSGMMHVAAALGRPQVAVFGSSDPRHTPPRSPNAKTLWLHLECSPCFERTCPLGHTDCLNKLSPFQVFESLKQAMTVQTERPPK